MSAAPQTRYPIIPGIPKAAQDELTTLRRMIYQLQPLTATSAPTVVEPAQSNVPVPVFVTTGSGAIVPGTPGGSGGSSVVQAYTNVPLLTTLPSNNPAQGQPYANDGLVVSVNGQVYRYNRTLLVWQAIASLSVVLTDTYANWTAANYPPANYNVGTEFLISDWGVKYIVKVVTGANAWVYESGMYAVAQTDIPTTGFNGAALGADDTELLVNVTDYAHVLAWGGTAWDWGPGEEGSGMIAEFAVAPTGVGWHLMDGSTVDYLKADGTLGTGFFLNNLTADPAFALGGSTYDGTINSPTAPTLSGNTGATGAAVTGTTGNDSASQEVQSGTGTTVAADPHTHDAGSLSADTHTHTLSSGTVSVAGGPPVNWYGVPKYFRQ